MVSRDRGREVLDAGPDRPQNRGVADILICCVDGLKGFPQAIEAIFPKTTVKCCVVHYADLRVMPTPTEKSLHPLTLAA